MQNLWKGILKTAISWYQASLKMIAMLKTSGRTIEDLVKPNFGCIILFFDLCCFFLLMFKPNLDVFKQIYPALSK